MLALYGGLFMVDCGFGLAAVGGVVLGFGLCSLIWYFRFLIYVVIVFEFSFIG